MWLEVVMYEVADVFSPEVIISSIVFTMVFEVSICKYNSFNAITSFDSGIAWIWIVLFGRKVDVIFTIFNKISPSV